MVLNDEGGMALLRAGEIVGTEILPESEIAVRIPCKEKLAPATFYFQYDKDPKPKTAPPNESAYEETYRLEK